MKLTSIVLSLFSAVCLLSSGTALASPEFSSAADSVPPGWVHVPGAIMRAECVHEIPNGAVTDDDQNVFLNGVKIAHYDKCAEKPVFTHEKPGTIGGGQLPTLNGWISAIEQKNIPLSSSDDIDYLSSTWTVPNFPTSNNGQVIYIWNGMIPNNASWLMQPVLQWGQICSVPGGVSLYPDGSNTPSCLGGNWWQIESWRVDLFAGWYSTPLGVNVGDSITGITEKQGVNGSNEQWVIFAEDNTAAVWTYQQPSFPSSYEWNSAYALVLEMQGTTNYCNQFPNTTIFPVTGIVIEHGYPNYNSWTGSPGWSGDTSYSNGDNPNCGYGAGLFYGTWVLTVATH